MVILDMRLSNAIKADSPQNCISLHFPISVRWANDQFFDFCQANKEWRIERTAGDCELWHLLVQKYESAKILFLSAKP